MDETGRESEEVSSEENGITSDSDDALSMYPTIPDGQEGEIDYGDFDSSEDLASTNFQDPYAAEYPALPVEAPTATSGDPLSLKNLQPVSLKSVSSSSRKILYITFISASEPLFAE